jgi:hypothetical protein
MDVDGKSKRVPAKIPPTFSLIQELHKMFMQPGFAKSLRDSRLDPSELNDDPDSQMEDIYHGSIWHHSFTNLTCDVGSDSSICNIPNSPTQVKLTSHHYDLHLIVNIDWYAFFISHIWAEKLFIID